MEKDAFWNVFRDTGDPVCWLLSRAARRQRGAGGKKREPRENRPSAPG